MKIISIQSQVVHGHVGNSAAVPVMQALGADVVAVPTALLSNHPHYLTQRGQALPTALLEDLLRGVDERGLVEEASAIITGYLGSAGNAKIVKAFMERAKLADPSPIYVCDPVSGDEDLGEFTSRELRAVLRDRLVPMADVITPNLWEARMLTGSRDVASPLALLSQLQALGPARIVITGGSSSGVNCRTLVGDASGSWEISTPRLQVRPAGTGDVLTAALTVGVANGETLIAAAAEAVSLTYSILERTSSEPWAEMPIQEMSREVASATLDQHRCTTVRKLAGGRL